MEARQEGLLPGREPMPDRGGVGFMKTAVVTGSTKGIGRAIGLELLSRGCMVVFNYSKDEESAQKLRFDLGQRGCQNRALVVKADLSRIEGIDMLLSETDGFLDSLDYLVLNAGTTWRGSLQELQLKEWERVLSTNLTVPLFLTQTLARRMTEGGCVLFIGSAMGQYPHTLSIPYGISKAAVHYLTRCLVKELAPQKARVNCLCPGFVETSWQTEKPLEIRASIESKIAMHRFADPEEVAQMAASILENPYMNGSLVNIDGGYCFQ